MTITTNDDNDNPLSDKYLHRGYDEPGTILGPSHQLFNLPNKPHFTRGNRGTETGYVACPSSH